MTLIKLFAAGQERELLWFSMNYHRNIRKNGKPSTEIMGGLITACFPSQMEDDLILRWMTKENKDNTWEEVDKMEKGNICFYENGFDHPPTKTYEFNDAHLIYYKEFFCTEGEVPMQTILTISPAIQHYGTTFVKRWNVSWVPPEEQPPHQPVESEDPKVLDYFLTDINSNRIEKATVGEKVFLNIDTKNLIGELLTISLNDKNVDFKYKGEKLGNDTISDYKIGNNLEIIELEIIKHEDNRAVSTFTLEVPSAEYRKSLTLYVLNDYPIIRITQQKTGKRVQQKIIGIYNGGPQFVDIDTYKVIVTNNEDPGFKIEFSVVRDAYAVIPGNDKGSTMILSNMSFEPKDGKINHYSGKYMTAYPKKNDTPAIKLTQRGSEVIHAEPRHDAVLLNYRSKNDVAAGVMIHVGGSYENEVYGHSISASEGCFGIVNDSNSSNNTSDALTKRVINEIWSQAQGSKVKPNHIRIIIEKRNETNIPNNIVFTKT